MDKPYIVSADIYLLMQMWAAQHGFVLPSQEFFSGLRDEFSRYMGEIFPSFELVSEVEITDGLAGLVVGSGLPAISLDRVYFESKLNLEIARLVDHAGQDRGQGHRAGAPPIYSQIQALRASGLREVAIVDDVIFSGALLERVIGLLAKMGVRVRLVCAGIGIGEGVKRVGAMCDVRCVRTYDGVIDEVCERDFYPGVPFSGRLLVGNGNIGVPYILPFGSPESWASIPLERAAGFSKFCLHQTVRLFEEVERCSGGRPVLCRDLGRKVLGLPADETRYAGVLRALNNP